MPKDLDRFSQIQNEFNYLSKLLSKFKARTNPE
jgi:hypothetical protein